MDSTRCRPLVDQPRINCLIEHLYYHFTAFCTMWQQLVTSQLFCFVSDPNGTCSERCGVDAVAQDLVHYNRALSKPSIDLGQQLRAHDLRNCFDSICMSCLRSS